MNLKSYFATNSQSALAKTLGVTQGAISHWVNGTSPIPADRCPAIEQATGGLVRCEDLRPDVLWSVVRDNQSPTETVPQVV